MLARLKKAYAQVTIGSPIDDGILLGPLIDGRAFESMQSALTQARADGGLISGGERTLESRYADAYYVTPAIAELPSQTDLVKYETFAPILYVMRYRNFDTAIAMHNDVPQGLSSCIFTRDVGEAEMFLSSAGSDCGLANVNIGPSGAEIGGAVRRREGNRWRPRIRLGRVAQLHAPGDEHNQLFERATAGPGDPVRGRLSSNCRVTELPTQACEMSALQAVPEPFGIRHLRNFCKPR